MYAECCKSNPQPPQLTDLKSRLNDLPDLLSDLLDSAFSTNFRPNLPMPLLHLGSDESKLFSDFCLNLQLFIPLISVGSPLSSNFRPESEIYCNVG